MIILGIESSTMVGSVALLSGQTLIGEYTLNLKRTHSERLMVAVDQLLGTSGLDITDIDAIGVSTGPGSYTGIRIGITTAKMLAWSLKKPIASVNSLEALAWSCLGREKVIIAPSIAAKGTLLFCAAYNWDRDDLVIDLEPTAMDIEEYIDRLLQLDKPVIPLGDGFIAHESAFKPLYEAERLQRVVKSQGLPRASLVAEACYHRLMKGEVSDVLALVPQYLRPPEAEIVWARKTRTGEEV